MVDWQAPEVINTQLAILQKTVHALAGMFIWEYFSTLDYEWEIISRKRPWRWTMAIYMSCRFFTLASCVTVLTGFDIPVHFDCTGWLLATFTFSYMALSLSSLLIVMRSIALWERRLPVVALSLAIWLVNVGFLLYGIVTANAVWDPSTKTCSILSTAKNKENLISTLITDFLLLAIMLGGIVRHKHDGGLWKMICRHGIIWIVLSAFAEIPPTVMVLLNYNAPLNLMFQTPALIALTIGSTRMYRNLQKYVDKVFGGLPNLNVPLTPNHYPSFIRRDARFSNVPALMPMSAVRAQHLTTVATTCDSHGYSEYTTITNLRHSMRLAPQVPQIDVLLEIPGKSGDDLSTEISSILTGFDSRGELPGYTQTHSTLMQLEGRYPEDGPRPQPPPPPPQPPRPSIPPPSAARASIIRTGPPKRSSCARVSFHG